jgi:hypothetical protein
MRQSTWWSIDAVFTVGIGVVMAAVFGGAFFARDLPREGSRLVPTSVLEQARQHQMDCQTTPEGESSQSLSC